MPVEHEFGTVVVELVHCVAAVVDHELGVVVVEHAGRVDHARPTERIQPELCQAALDK
jgi:hypothetical protein